MNKLTLIYFSEYSLLDILGLDRLEAVVGGVEGGKEEPHKRVDRPRHLGKERNERFDLKPTFIELEHYHYTPHHIIHHYPLSTCSIV